MSRKLLLAAIAATALGVTPALAQDFNLPPAFGEVTLQAGFTPDPFTVEIVAGGDIDVGTTIGVDANGNSCIGIVANAPDYRLQYTAGSFPLIFSFLSDGDTTLVINAPDGSWYCDDDGAGYPNPMIEFGNPLSGQYDIWVGAFLSGNPEGTLNISEIGGTVGGPVGGGGGGGPDFTLPPAFGEISLSAGFTPDPFTVDLVAGGNIDAFEAIGGNCYGSIAEAPDYRLQYSAGGFPLILSVLSGNDTTLVVNGPDGSWYCDDDSAGNLNPMVRFDNPSSGQYDIWVGTFGGGTANATLNISEIGTGGGAAGGPNFDLPPAFGEVALSTGFAPHSVGLIAGGEIDASINPGNGADGSFCVGMIAEAPDYRLQFNAGNIALIFSVLSSDDTTLVINAPDGSWYCDDDGGGYPNPQVRFDAPLSGQYDIWVGAYFTGNPEATLQISEAGGK
jgi:hypothetical protein